MQTTHDQQTGTTEPGFYEGVINPYLGRTRFGWEVDPVGFRTTLRAVYERYRLPLLVTENGLGDCDSLDADGTVTDDYRIEYLQAHIAVSYTHLHSVCAIITKQTGILILLQVG